MTPARSVWLIGLALAGCVEPASVRVPDEPLRQPGAPLVHEASLSRQAHELVNQERALRHLRPLRWSDLLAQVAERHSRDMTARGFFDHVTPDGRTPEDRATRANATCGGQRSGRVLENLAQTWLYRGRTDIHEGTEHRVEYDWRTEGQIAEETITRWIRSRPHREALLDPTARHQGIGVAIRWDGHVLITQVLC